MSIWHQLLGRYYKNELFSRTKKPNTLKDTTFLSFARKFGDKYGKKLVDSTTKTGIDAVKTA